MSQIQQTLLDCLKTLNKELKHISYGQNICLLQLPKALHNHFRIAQFHDSRVIMVTTDACWITQLRQYEIRMIAALNQAGYLNIKTIEWRINPKLKLISPATIQKPKKAHKVSIEASEYIVNSAKYCKGIKTKEQLLKLASTLKKKATQ